MKKKAKRQKKLEKRIKTYERRKENYEKELSQLEVQLEVKRKELVETENTIIQNQSKIERSEKLEQELKNTFTAVRQFGENLGTIAGKLPDKQAEFLENVIEKASSNIRHPVMDVLLDAFYSDQARDIIR